METLWRLATLNVRSLSGKEVELADEISNADVDILRATETKKKGKRMQILERRHVMIYCSVSQKHRAKDV